ncbi:uncharacterized protein BKA55DRAFT_710648 [Fusarium redolens]|uniref:Uncharacterized protein n=1 Tax=Fusarium redolens TaxID=48865 RepID=A0A9P9JP27_FUSRE|nr:uncharacterized protein BKA55DRAFT_710648 [Fusarium redolens]KAH7232257.1 hypothetical protein BKA55DRAFT_710648 [Fusarium redolens]
MDQEQQVLAEISFTTLNLLAPQEQVELHYEIRVDWCKLRSSCTVKGKRESSITMVLDSFGHIPHEEIERLKADDKRYKMTDDAENHQVSVLDDLDTHISSLDETLHQLTKSLVVEGLSKSLGTIMKWTEQNPHAKVAEHSPEGQGH